MKFSLLITLLFCLNVGRSQTSYVLFKVSVYDSIGYPHAYAYVSVYNKDSVLLSQKTLSYKGEGELIVHNYKNDSVYIVISGPNGSNIRSEQMVLVGGSNYTFLFDYSMQTSGSSTDIKKVPANTTNTTNSNNSNSTCVTVQCSGTTQSGTRCKNRTTNCNGRCHLH